jgi:hypothetical protein
MLFGVSEYTLGASHHERPLRGTQAATIVFANNRTRTGSYK